MSARPNPDRDPRPLVERAADDNPDVAYAARLLRAGRDGLATPPAIVGRKQRVWSRLHYWGLAPPGLRPGTHRARRGSRFGALALSPAAALGLVCALVAVAGATIGRGVLARLHRAPAIAPRSIAPRHPAHPARAPSSAPIAEPIVAPEPLAPPPPAPALPSIGTAPPPRPHSAPSRLARPSRIEPVPPARQLPDRARDDEVDDEPHPAAPDPAAAIARRAAAPDDPEVALLTEAVNARNHGDWARVAALVDQYRRRYPSGVFAEEALALAIEAAGKQHAPDAAALGALYLERYPSGRYLDLARRAVRPLPR